MYNLDTDSSEQLSNMSFTKTQEINQEQQYTKLKDNSIKKIVDSLILNVDNTKTIAKIEQKKGKSCQKWSKKNAKIFEKVINYNKQLLHILGTDFALIEEYFRLHTDQHFNEKLLRNKYKREYQYKKIKQSNQFSELDSLDREIQQNLSNSQ